MDSVDYNDYESVRRRIEEIQLEIMRRKAQIKREKWEIANVKIEQERLLQQAERLQNHQLELDEDDEEDFDTMGFSEN